MKPTAFDSLHPALALAYFGVALVLAMAAPHPVLLALSFAVAVSYGAWLRGVRAVVRSFSWQLPLLVVIVAVNPLFSSTGTTELFRIGTQAVYAEGYANAATMALLLLCVMQWFANADAVLGSDKVMGVLGGALPTTGLMVSMAMRLIPHFVRRGRTIESALGACTAACIPGTERLRIATTLMGWSMENSLETADSMRCRGWGVARKRTTFRRNRFRSYDALVLSVLALLSAVAAVAAYSLMDGFGFFPSFHGSWGNPFIVLYALALCFPLALELLGKVRR